MTASTKMRWWSDPCIGDEEKRRLRELAGLAGEHGEMVIRHSRGIEWLHLGMMWLDFMRWVQTARLGYHEDLDEYLSDYDLEEIL